MIVIEERQTHFKNKKTPKPITVNVVGNVNHIHSEVIAHEHFSV